MAAPSNDAPSSAAPTNGVPVVIRISPMAHIASGFMTVFTLVFFPAWGPWALLLLVIPVLISVLIVRLRTVADRTNVTARTLLSSRTVPWTHVEGLRFDRGNWARACRQDGSELLLPAVTFATLPTLNEASGGRVPDPYLR